MARGKTATTFADAGSAPTPRARVDYRLFEGADDGIVAVGERNYRLQSSMRVGGAVAGVGAVGERNRDCQVDRNKCSCGHVDNLNINVRRGD